MRDRPPIRIVLADDAYLARVALRHLFEGVPAIAIVGECDDANSVVPVLDKQRADLLITDIRMPPTGQDEGIRLAASGDRAKLQSPVRRFASRYAAPPGPHSRQRTRP